MKKIISIILAVISAASVTALVACNNEQTDNPNTEQEQGQNGGGQQEEGQVYVPEDGAVYVFSECTRYDVTSDGQTNSLIEMANQTYAGSTLRFSGNLLIMESEGDAVSGGQFEFIRNGDRFDWEYDIAEYGIEQHGYFTVTAEQLILYGETFIADNDGYQTEQQSVLVYVAQ